MEGPDGRRIGADHVRNAARQNIAEKAEAGPQHGMGLKLPRDGGSRLENGQWRGGEQIAQVSLDGGIQRLIDIMRDRVEGAAKTRHTVVRIQGIGIQRVPNTERPGQLGSHFPRVLRVEVEIEEVERLVGGQGESFRRGRGHSVNELRQGRVGHRRNRAFAEVIVIQAENSSVGAKPEFVRRRDSRPGCH